MIKSILLRPYSAPILVEVKDIHRSGLSPLSKTRFASTIRCSSSNDAYIPKLEPFSRTKFERVVKDPPLIEKSENDLAGTSITCITFKKEINNDLVFILVISLFSDYCSTLEGDESYSCWRAYFELKDLEKEVAKEEVEHLIIQAGGVKSLIGFLHGIASIHNTGNNKGISSKAKPLQTEHEGKRFSHIPDGLPKSAEEIEEEERARMLDSPFTRMLRTKGTFPAWYSPAPDHETH
uniref:Uncharacterized protein n=1 Tax=Gossypium raimondii TaxID=29730 RepID=A0A0D2R7Y0_GOSRA|nr:hypothetical protein B456_008G026800 [Gossypium raimondii]